MNQLYNITAIIDTRNGKTTCFAGDPIIGFSLSGGNATRIVEILTGNRIAGYSKTTRIFFSEPKDDEIIRPEG